MTVVLGIDAAWTCKNPSGLAVLVGHKNAEDWQCVAVAPSYAAFLGLANGKPIEWGVGHGGTMPDPEKLLASAERLAGARVDIVAIDMPISTRPIDGRRTADQEISREFGSRWCSAHSPSSVRPGKLGTKLSTEFERLGYPIATAMTRQGTGSRIVEVYPHPALLGLLGRDKRVPYKVSRCRQYWPGKGSSERIELLLGEFQFIYNRLVEVLGPIPFDLPLFGTVIHLAHLKRYEDALDAVVSAWVGVQYLKGSAVPFGDADSAVWCPASSTTSRASIPSPMT